MAMTSSFFLWVLFLSHFFLLFPIKSPIYELLGFNPVCIRNASKHFRSNFISIVECKKNHSNLDALAFDESRFDFWPASQINGHCNDLHIERWSAHRHPHDKQAGFFHRSCATNNQTSCLRAIPAYLYPQKGDVEFPWWAYWFAGFLLYQFAANQGSCSKRSHGI